MRDFMRCAICGRFISGNDLETNRVISHFTPDSDFSTEDIWYEHLNCLLKEEPCAEKMTTVLPNGLAISINA